MNTHPFRHAAVAAAVVAASAGASLDVQAATPSGTVVFEREQQSPGEAFPRNRSLWLLDIGTGKVRPLTTATDRVFDGGATWAPDGSGFVFERATTRLHPQERHTLRYMAAGATKHRNLLNGQGDFSKPAWGPGNRIAYVSKDSASQCVSLTDGAGKTRRTLFCVKATTELARPQWSRDGRKIFIAAIAPEGRLEPIFHALAFRIDVATGRGTLMSDIVMDWPLELTFSPDGTRGVYADAVAGDMTLVDFRNGATSELPRGHAPAWSPDGKRIAFTGEMYETGAEFRYYEPLYVMNADGSNVRRLTSARIADHAYLTAQWSKDNVHLLVNRRTFTDDSLTHAQYSLRVIDANTKALKQLPGGLAEPGGWFER